MKTFNFQSDMRLRDLKQGKHYFKNGFNVFYLCGDIAVQTYCKGTHKFKTLREAKTYIKNYID